MAQEWGRVGTAVRGGSKGEVAQEEVGNDRIGPATVVPEVSVEDDVVL
jgi:hypothetical protein